MRTLTPQPRLFVVFGWLFYFSAFGQTPELKFKSQIENDLAPFRGLIGKCELETDEGLQSLPEGLDSETCALFWNLNQTSHTSIFLSGESKLSFSFHKSRSFKDPGTSERKTKDGQVEYSNSFDRDNFNFMVSCGYDRPLSHPVKEKQNLLTLKNSETEKSVRLKVSYVCGKSSDRPGSHFVSLKIQYRLDDVAFEYEPSPHAQKIKDYPVERVFLGIDNTQTRDGGPSRVWSIHRVFGSSPRFEFSIDPLNQIGENSLIIENKDRPLYLFFRNPQSPLTILSDTLGNIWIHDSFNFLNNPGGVNSFRFYAPDGSYEIAKLGYGHLPNGEPLFIALMESQGRRWIRTFNRKGEVFSGQSPKSSDELSNFSGRVLDFAIDQNSHSLILLNESKVVSWSFEQKPRPKKILFEGLKNPEKLALAPSSNYLYVTDYQGTLGQISLADNRFKIVSRFSGSIYDLAFEPSGEFVFLSTGEGRVLKWSTEKNKEVGHIVFSEYSPGSILPYSSSILFTQSETPAAWRF